MNPRVKKVQALENYLLELVFDNGEVRIFDVSPYLDRGIFKELRDKSFFKSVTLFMGSVKWPHDQDFGPDTLYQESIAKTRH
jgi:hypothetical protein